MTILYINATIKPNSRTKRLADYLLSKFDDEITEVNIAKENIQPLTEETLELRTSSANEGNYDEPIFHYAKQYAQADYIVIAAPYWDLSFPSYLKLYIEAINIPGVVFQYDDNGKTIGLCNAKQLIYITTSGGKIDDDDFGYGYIKELAKKYHGIPHTEKIEAENLDIIGADIEGILKKAENKIDRLLKDCKSE